jgi:SAM-dependent methyltransferase
MPIQPFWHPDKPTSKGATAYHDAVIHASWYDQNLNELVRIVSPKINPGDTVVDFGAGTGVSAIYLLKNIDATCPLWLVDNSAAWLGKAHEILAATPQVRFLLLKKHDERYATLAETIGSEAADCVVSANVFHLIPDLDRTFEGIASSLKKGGVFALQSGNIARTGRQPDLLMIDDTINDVHDIALDIVRKDEKYSKYRDGLDERIELESRQRKFIFPQPRPVEIYVDSMERSGFACEPPVYQTVKVTYQDWFIFLRVKRLQAGILPEIGSKEPTPEQEHDRDELIALASVRLFEGLKARNKFADAEGFSVEWVHLSASKR